MSAKTYIPAAYLTQRLKKTVLPTTATTLLGLIVVTIFLAPLAYMSFTAFKTLTQVQDPYSQLLPSSPVTVTIEGVEYPLLNVPTETGNHEWALINKGRESSEFIDPLNPGAGLIEWEGRWRVLKP